MSLTWGEALSLHRARRELRALSPATIKLEQALLGNMGPRLGACPAAVTRADVETYLAKRFNEVSPSTVARELWALRQLFLVLVDEGHAEQDPTEGFSAKVPEQPQLVLSHADVRAMLSAASVPVKARRSPEINEAVALRNRAILEILYGAGIRASELCRALVTDLDLTGPSLFVRRVKGGPHESLPLPHACGAHLRDYLSEGRPVLLRLRDASRGALVVNERGARLTPNHLHRLVTRIANRAGVRANPHVFRRTVATGLVRSGASLPAVQALLGHKRLDTTQRYVHVDVEDLREAVQPLDTAR